MKKKSKLDQIASEYQQLGFDFGDYSTDELIGSHADNLEDAATIRKKGKASKYDPTWDMDDRQLAAFAMSYHDRMQEIYDRFPASKQ